MNCAGSSRGMASGVRLGPALPTLPAAVATRAVVRVAARRQVVARARAPTHILRCRGERVGNRNLPAPTRLREKQAWKLQASEDDFEVEDAVDYELDSPEDDEDENDMRDYDPEPDLPVESFLLTRQSKTLDLTEGDQVETVVDYKIKEEDFHKISLHQCDFFIRKVEDPDGDVYDFGEMYVTPPDTDVYAIPKKQGKMPTKPIRLTMSNYEYICNSELPAGPPRSPMSKNEKHVMKVFLMKHYRNRRHDDYDFVLDFEEVYVIDTRTKTISRAPVEVHVPGGKKRDRSDDLLIVRDDGNSFRIIHQNERRTPCEIVGALQWEKSREMMETYLRGFRDYEVSNWF